MPNKPRELDDIDRDLYRMLDESQSRETITPWPGAYSDLKSRGLVTVTEISDDDGPVEYRVRARKANRRRKYDPLAPGFDLRPPHGSAVAIAPDGKTVTLSVTGVASSPIAARR